jgi:F-type H+-transporting ATPase subunit b
MDILNLFTDLPPGEGFGFNGNILETNLLNLAVVIGVVVSFGGDALRSLLLNRKQTILNNLREADQRANEAQEKLNRARNRLELAQKKGIEIREQGKLAAEQEKREAVKKTEEDAFRLEETKQETIRFQQQKVVNQVSQQVIELSLNRVREKFKTRLDARFHASVNNFNIVLFRNYKKS